MKELGRLYAGILIPSFVTHEHVKVVIRLLRTIRQLTACSDNTCY
jgi:hypothetical protein